VTLTAKQQAFVEEYLIDLNATQAAIRAGYSERSAAVTASRMLTKANIAEAVVPAKDQRSERTQITQDWVAGGLVEVEGTVSVRGSVHTYQ